MSGLGADFAQTVLSGPLLLAAGAAALAGLVSFASPCVLPLVPGYVGYVTGLSGSSLRDKQTWRVVVGISLFVLGFTVVFVLLGTSFSALGALFSQWQRSSFASSASSSSPAGFVFGGRIRPAPERAPHPRQTEGRTLGRTGARSDLRPRVGALRGTDAVGCAEHVGELRR